MGTDDCSHFDQIRIQNRRIIRNLMRGVAQIGKAELADISGLSYPTVSALLSDLCQTGEVVVLPEQATRGGRPAEQFALNPLFQAAACAYIENHQLFLRVYDVSGQVLFDRIISLTPGICDKEVRDHLLAVKEKYPVLTVICLGIPGVIVNGQITYLPDYPEFHGCHLQDFLEKALSVPVHLENDVNVFVFAEREKWSDLVHIFRGTNCAGAGILINRTILRGAGGCAGEVEYLPFEHKGRSVNFSEKLSLIINEFAGEENVPARRKELVTCIARAAASIVCLINPPDIALSGFELTDADAAELSIELAKLLPSERVPVFHIVNQIDDLYQSGLFQIALDYWKSR